MLILLPINNYNVGGTGHQSKTIAVSEVEEPNNEFQLVNLALRSLSIVSHRQYVCLLQSHLLYLYFFVLFLKEQR